MPPQLSRVEQLRLYKHPRTRSAAFGPMLDDLVDLSRRQQPPMTCPHAPAARHVADPNGFPPGRGGADGGSCDGGNDEFRELRFNRRSSSPTRASSRPFASTNSPSATTTRSPTHDHHQGSPQPRPAPHNKVRRRGPRTLHRGERLHFWEIRQTRQRAATSTVRDCDAQPSRRTDRPGSCESLKSPFLRLAEKAADTACASSG